MGQAALSGNGNYVLDVDAALSGAQNVNGNFSPIYWRSIVYKNAGTGFQAAATTENAGWVDSHLGGNFDLWQANNFPYDFRTSSGIAPGQFLTFAQGVMNVPHDANGYANYFVEGAIQLVTLGSARTGTGWRSLPRIPKPPSAPAVIGLDQISQTSMRYRFSQTDSGGLGVLEWQIGYGLSPTSPESLLTSSGTSVVTGLQPYRDYYFWSRGRNARGWGPWSARATARTLSGGRLRIGGAWAYCVPYVKHNNIWKVAVPYVKHNNVWKVSG